MSPLDQTLAVPIDPVVVIAPDWSSLADDPARVLRVPCLSRTWAMRRTIARARAALIAMRLEEAAKALSEVSALMRHLARPRRERYLPVVRLLEASLQVASDQLPAAHELLRRLPEHSTDSMVAPLLRYLDWQRGGCDEGVGMDGVDYLVPPVGGGAIARIFSLCISAALSFDRLHLTVSSSLAAEALALARERYGNHSALSVLPATLLAQVAYEQGRLEEAELLLRPRIAQIRAAGMLECLARASIILARLSLHRGQRRAALATLRDAEAMGHSRRWPRLVSLASGEYSRILSIIHHEDARLYEPSPPARSRHATQWRRTSGEPELSLRLRRLSSCEETAWSAEPYSYTSIEASLRRACAAALDARLDDCHGPVMQWLRVGATRGLRMIFVDSGPQLVAALERIYDSLAMSDAPLATLRPYLATLLRFAVPPASAQAEPPTYRPLSRRETAILEMIAEGMSNKHIAQDLGITPETVKSHAKSIFVKLDSRTRAQAVARAESMGLL